MPDGIPAAWSMVPMAPSSNNGLPLCSACRNVIGISLRLAPTPHPRRKTENLTESLGVGEFLPPSLLKNVEKNKRKTGNVTSRMAFMTPNYLVGFENHKGATYLERGLNPLSYVDIGYGNNGSDKTEGVMEKNIIGTYLTGPLLPRNVYFSDYLIKVTMEAKYHEEFEILDEENTLEEDVHFDFIKIKH